MNTKPNIIFILSDDQCPYSLGCLNYSELKTPNLDELAKEGTMFTNCFCGSPVCSPARATILTGTIPSYHGVHDWIRSGNLQIDDFDFPHDVKEKYDYLIEDKAIDYLRDLPTYTEILHDNGYNCALSGKWHLGNSIKPQCGFEKWYTIGKGGCDNYMDPDVIEDGKISFPKKYLTDLITDKAIEFIDELNNDEKPFYLSVNYIAPHTPWEHYSHKKEHLDLYKDCDYEKYYPHHPNHPWAKAASKSYNSDEKRKWLFSGYEAAMTAMDEGIGKIIEKVKELNIYDNTVFIFTSDNGFNLGHHGIFGKGNGTYPTNVYEEAIKVPFIASWKDHFISDNINDSFVSHYDLFPTILDIANVDYKMENKQPGHSFINLLNGKDKERAEDVFIYDEYGDTRMIRTKRYKYVDRTEQSFCALYDLEKDPEETMNLIDSKEYEDIKVSLKNQLNKWFNSYMNAKRDSRITPATGNGQVLFYEDENKEDIFYK